MPGAALHHALAATPRIPCGLPLSRPSRHVLNHSNFYLGMYSVTLGLRRNLLPNFIHQRRAVSCNLSDKLARGVQDSPRPDSLICGFMQVERQGFKQRRGPMARSRNSPKERHIALGRLNGVCVASGRKFA